MAFSQHIRFWRKVSNALNQYADKSLIINKPTLKLIFKSYKNDGKQAEADKERLFHLLDQYDSSNIFIQVLFKANWDPYRIKEFILNRNSRVTGAKNPRYKPKEVDDFMWYYSHYLKKIDTGDIQSIEDFATGMTSHAVTKYLAKFASEAVRVMSILAVEFSGDPEGPTKVHLNVLELEYRLSDEFSWFILPVIVPPFYEGWTSVGELRTTNDSHYLFLVGNHQEKIIKIMDASNFFYDDENENFTTGGLYIDVVGQIIDGLRLIKNELWSWEYVLAPECPGNDGECGSIGLWLAEKTLEGLNFPEELTQAERTEYRQKMVLYLEQFVADE